jgi:hypothetical protein
MNGSRNSRASTTPSSVADGSPASKGARGIAGDAISVLPAQRIRQQFNLLADMSQPCRELSAVLDVLLQLRQGLFGLVGSSPLLVELFDQLGQAGVHEVPFVAPQHHRELGDAGLGVVGVARGRRLGWRLCSSSWVTGDAVAAGWKRGR